MKNDVELFELCKKVYELTRWDDGEHWFGWIEAHSAYEIDDGLPAVPLYTSDYLLEKLPEQIVLVKTSDDSGAIFYSVSHQEAGLGMGDSADTSLKALLKLTIALKEAGVEL